MTGSELAIFQRNHFAMRPTRSTERLRYDDLMRKIHADQFHVHINIYIDQTPTYRTRNSLQRVSKIMLIVGEREVVHLAKLSKLQAHKTEQVGCSD